MGNRSSISFKHKDDESVALFSHWGGEEFQKDAEEWLSNFAAKNRQVDNCSTPFTRLEPSVLMVQFIQQACDKDSYSLYLGKTQYDGDNSDHGHLTIDVEEYL